MGNVQHRLHSHPAGSTYRHHSGSPWPFWRVVYWLCILALIAAICVGAYFTLKSDFGECTSYDVRCD
ncbi:hypothetical protein KR018_002529 [Drosophila ironensis]|nr:hypothetical protein KR018_002529 [Drosophila ironensis]